MTPIADGLLLASGARIPRIGFGVELGLLALATVLAFATDAGSTGTGRDVVVAILACAMGVQNALIRRHGVVDVATNVMTMTLAGLLSESKVVGGTGAHWARRSGSIGIFFVGAIGGAYLTRFGAGWGLLVATVLLAGAVSILITDDRPAH